MMMPYPLSDSKCEGWFASLCWFGSFWNRNIVYILSGNLSSAVFCPVRYSVFSMAYCLVRYFVQYGIMTSMVLTDSICSVVLRQQKLK